jgi:aminobenzoyl-glutamate utilization protein B
VWDTPEKAPAAHTGMTHAAKAMAPVAARLLADPALLAAARAEHAARRAADPDIRPIPPALAPPLQPRPAG